MTQNQITHRRVSHCMGAWKWGYPRGIRTAIVEYRVGRLAGGQSVWKSSEEVCDGLTAANIETYQARYPEAFRACHGSIHNEKVT